MCIKITYVCPQCRTAGNFAPIIIPCAHTNLGPNQENIWLIPIPQNSPPGVPVGLGRSESEACKRYTKLYCNNVRLPREFWTAHICPTPNCIFNPQTYATIDNNVQRSLAKLSQGLPIVKLKISNNGANNSSSGTTTTTTTTNNNNNNSRSSSSAPAGEGISDDNETNIAGSGEVAANDNDRTTNEQSDGATGNTQEEIVVAPISADRKEEEAAEDTDETTIE